MRMPDGRWHPKAIAGPGAKKGYIFTWAGIMPKWLPPDYFGGGGGTVINVIRVLDTLFTSPTGAFISNSWFDGNRDYNNWANANSGTQELVIDLGQEVDINKIRWVLYWGDTRTYANVAVYASHNNSTWTTLRSPATYQPSLDGIDGLVLTAPGTWRYLKFHSEGNSVNNNNEWVEFGVYASL